MRRLAGKLKFPALLFLITVAFCWKLVLPDQYTWINGPDNANQVLPWLQAQAVQWHTGHFPLWDPHAIAGEPFIGQVQPGTLNPLNWILFSAPLKNGFIQIPILHWYWVMIHFLGVLSGYWLCRDLKLSASASVFGGCAFGLGGFMGAIGWPQLMMSAVLLPLILMFFLRALRQENALSNAAASGALLGASFLSGHHNVPVFFAVVMSALWIYYAFTQRLRRGSVAAQAAAFLACFALIAAAQILPSIELGRLSVRWVGARDPLGWNDRVPYAVHESFSLYPTAILGIVLPGFQRDSAVFIGLVPFTLALLGAAAKWQQQVVRLVSGVALGGIALSLGGYSLFQGVLYALVPDLDKSRSPSMAEAIFHLGIIVLAAYGVDSLRSQSGNAWANGLAIRSLSATSLFLYALLIVLITVRPEKSEEYKFLGFAALAAIVLAGIIRAWSGSQLSHPAGACALILLLLFELNTVTNYPYHPLSTETSLHNLEQNHDIAAFLKTLPDHPRVDVDEKEIPYSFGDWFGVDSLNGNQPSALKSIADVMWEKPFRRLLAVNYFVGRKPSTPEQSVVFEGRSGLKVFEIPTAFPRARIVHVAAGAPGGSEVMAAVLNPSTDLQRTVVVPGPPPSLATCDGGAVQVQRYRPTSVVLHTSSPCRAMVVLADIWFPGWQAFVDGKPARIWKAYNVVRGVVVDGGEHQVVMIYRPASVFSGMALALVGIIVCVALQCVRIWSSARAQSPGEIG